MNQTAVSLLEAAFFKLEHAVIKETALNRQSGNDL